MDIQTENYCSPIGLLKWHCKSVNVFQSAHLHWNLYLSSVTTPSCNNRNIKTDSLASWKWVWGMFALRVQYNDLAYKEWCTVQLPRDQAIEQHIKTLNGKRHKIHYVSAEMKRLTLLALSKWDSVQYSTCTVLGNSALLQWGCYAETNSLLVARIESFTLLNTNAQLTSSLRFSDVVIYRSILLMMIKAFNYT